MKFVINACYGGFSLKQDVANELGFRSDYCEFNRSDPRLINLVEKEWALNGNDTAYHINGPDRVKIVSGDYALLKVVEIPDEATDWAIRENDGLETLIYVKDGRLHYLY